MKHFLLKLVMLLALLTLVSSCKLFRHVPKDNDNTEITFGEPSMRNGFNFEATLSQVDSVCIADTLPTWNRWTGRQFEDFETGFKYVKLMYIKTFNKNKEVIYILLMDEEEPYPFQKRIVER